MSDLLKKLLKAGSVKDSAMLSESKFFTKDIIRTDIPALNIAFTGDIDGGVVSGLTTIAGPSRHFKSNICLACIRAYFEHHPESFCLFYDCEFGITKDYLKNQGVDPAKMIHIPIKNIEELKFDVSQRLEELSRGDKVIIFIDSIGNMASKKEAEDALDGKGAADMTRAKQLKSLFRIMTPHLSMKDIPCLAVNHTYDTQEMYSKKIISGGTGVMYSSDQAFIIGRQQEKEGQEIVGYNFVINVEKSRTIREKSKIPLNVTFEKGINKYSGVLELALEGKFVAKPSMGWYQLVDQETGELVGGKVRAKETENEEFLGQVLKSEAFKKFVSKKYKVAGE